MMLILKDYLLLDCGNRNQLAIEIKCNFERLLKVTRHTRCKRRAGGARHFRFLCCYDSGELFFFV